jgi:hypothetical protein
MGCWPQNVGGKTPKSWPQRKGVQPRPANFGKPTRTSTEFHIGPRKSCNDAVKAQQGKFPEEVGFAFRRKGADRRKPESPTAVSQPN